MKDFIVIVKLLFRKILISTENNVIKLNYMFSGSTENIKAQP